MQARTRRRTNIRYSGLKQIGKSTRIGVLVVVATIVTLPALSLGCSDMEQFQGVLPSSEFSVSQVPDTDLDLYVYAKQKTLTTVPADLINMPEDIQVESLAIWGVPGENAFAMGSGLTFANEITAAEIYSRIVQTDDIWKFIRGNNLYVVKGSGTAADSLKKAITQNDFKVYDNKQLLEVARLLPQTVRAKLIAIALANPSKELVNFIGTSASITNLEQVNQILKLANLEVLISGIYSPNNINIARAVQIAHGNGNLSDLNLGILVAVKSRLPGILVETNMRNILVQQGLKPITIEGLDLYKGYYSNPYVDAIPVYARIEGSYVFISVSGQESYAETLITSIYK